jgi:hypothetical protein
MQTTAANKTKPKATAAIIKGIRDSVFSFVIGLAPLSPIHTV